MEKVQSLIKLKNINVNAMDYVSIDYAMLLSTNSNIVDTSKVNGDHNSPYSFKCLREGSRMQVIIYIIICVMNIHDSSVPGSQTK